MSGGAELAWTADPRVEAYLDRMPAWQRILARRVRVIVHDADPAVSETIKRSVQPYVVLEGNVAAVVAGQVPSVRLISVSTPRWSVPATRTVPEEVAVRPGPSSTWSISIIAGTFAFAGKVGRQPAAASSVLLR